MITERERALQVLELLVRENEYRLHIFRDLEVKNLDEYNKKTKQNLCRIGVFTDELAEMLDKKGVAKEEREIYENVYQRWPDCPGQQESICLWAFSVRMPMC